MKSKKPAVKEIAIQVGGGHEPDADDDIIMESESETEEAQDNMEEVQAESADSSLPEVMELLNIPQEDSDHLQNTDNPVYSDSDDDADGDDYF